MLMTLGYLPLPPLLKLRQIAWVPPRATHATVQGVFHDERPQRLMFVAAEHVDKERVRLRVLAASAAAAEAARSKGRSFTGPAVQPSRSPRCRAQPGVHIMRRPGPKFAYFFVRRPDQSQEVIPSE